MERERPKGTGQGVPTSKGCWLALVKAWLQKIARRGMLGPLFQFLHKFFSWDPTAVPLWLLGTRSGALSPPDPLLHPAKKRLGVVTHSLLALLPSRFKRALECATAMAQRSVSAVGTKPSANPAGKGTKRKQDDLDLEEDQTWIDTLQQELPDEDDPGDRSYEPVKSDTDSEEYRSQNSTEVDLEYEEKDGIIMLKEHQNPEGPPSEGNGALGKPRPDADSKAEEPLFRTSGDGSENPRRQEPRGTRGRTLQGLILANGRSPEHEVPLRRQIQGSEATLNGNAQKQGLERADE